MKLIPIPKNIRKCNGFLKSKSIKVLSFPEDIRLTNELKTFTLEDDGVLLEICVGKEETEGYSINIESEKITIIAESSAGAFYAMQTLKQIFLNDEIPCCFIEDAPDFKYRGFYHDITRGKVPRVETIKKLVDEMAYYKLNSLQLYVEHTFEFKEYADSIERTGYLTAEEIREIDDYCKMKFVEFIPSLSTFGHLYELLQNDRYKHLREIEDSEDSKLFWDNRMMHHTIDPTSDESFELIKSLIDQYVVNFSTDKFNICCDETFDLKVGRHREQDTGRLYIEFVTKLIEYLKGKGKTVMMWADILLNHPEQIDNLPKDVQLLNWYYWDNPDENTFKTLKEGKCNQIVCPGTGSWSRLCEDYEMDIINITKMCDLGYKYGAEGVLNTNWGDWGNPCSIELAMFGLVLGAAKSWNVSTNVDGEYISAVNKLLYKKENADLYIKRLSVICAKINWNNFAKCYGNVISNSEVYKDIQIVSEKDVLETLEESFNIIRELKNDEWQDEYKEQILLSAEGVAVMAELMALYAGYSVVRKTNTEKWLQKYREKWLEANKESELSEIEKLFYTLEKATTEK